MAVPIELAKSNRYRSGGNETQKKGVCFIPLTVESFLWQQTCSFMRARLSKVCDAACASLERILVQGILDGLTPPLAQAINSTPRWFLIRGAFPHILHSCAALLRHRASFGISGERLSSSESKMMYILHWILLDALSECVDSSEFKNESLRISNYLLSLDDIRLLVYAIVPLLHTLRESNFNAPRLEAGLKIWQALWRFRQPDVVFLSMPVRVRPHDARLMLQTKPASVGTTDIYLGDSSSNPTKSRDRCQSSSSRGPSVNYDTIMSPVLSNEVAGSQRQVLNEELPSDLAAVPSAAVPFLSVGSISGRQSSSKGPAARGETQCCGNRSPKVISSLHSPTQNNNKVPNGSEYSEDLSKATYFDVAVLQCLLGTEPWCEEGVHWSIKYLHHRVLDIHTEVSRAVACAAAAARLGRSYSFGWRRQQPTAGLKSFIPSFVSSTSAANSNINRTASFEKLRLMFASASAIRSPYPFRRQTDMDQLSNKAPRPLQKSDANSEANATSPEDLSIISNKTNAMSDSYRPTGLLKSYTDSALKSGYETEQLEADGCQHYTLPDGCVDLEVVLLATALACRRHSSLRVCQSAIQVIHSLILLGVFGSSKTRAQGNKVSPLHCSPVVAAAIAGDEHRRLLASGAADVTAAPRNGKTRTSDFCDRDPPLVTNHNIAVGTLLKIYEILGAPSTSNSSRQSYTVNKISAESQPCIDYREQLMAYVAETARELHRVDRHQFHAYVNEYVSAAPLGRLVRLYLGALGGKGGGSFAQNSLLQPPPNAHPSAAPNLRAKDSTPVVRHSLRQWLTSISKHLETFESTQSVSILRDISYILNTLAVLHPRLLRRVSVSCILDVVPSGFGERLTAKSKQTAADAEKTEKGKAEDAKTKNGADKENNEKASTFEKFEKILEKMRLKDAAAAVLLPQSSPERTMAEQSPLQQNPPSTPMLTTPRTPGLEPPHISVEDGNHGIAPSSSVSTEQDRDRLGSVGSASSITTTKVPILLAPHSAAGSEAGDQPQQQTTLPPSGRKKITFKTFGMATLLVLNTKFRNSNNAVNAGNNADATSQSGANAEGASDTNGKSRRLKDTEASHDSGLNEKLSHTEPEEPKVIKIEPPLDAASLFAGIRRLNLLIELGIPSALPEAGLVASMLDLKAPVLARACFLLECAVAIHSVNKQPARLVAHLPPASSAAESTRLQLNAFRQMAKVCHGWAEALGARLAKIMTKELTIGCSFTQSSASSSATNREECENYFQDNTVNNEDGDGCPHALKRLACMILLEATIFLRETFRTNTKELLNKKYTPNHAVAPLAPMLSGQEKTLPSASPSIGSRQQAERLLGHSVDHASDSVYGSNSSLDQNHSSKEGEKGDTPAPSKYRTRSGSTRRMSVQKSSHQDHSVSKRYSIQHSDTHGSSSSPRHSPRELSEAALESPSQTSVEFPVHDTATPNAGQSSSTAQPPQHSHQAASAALADVDDQQLVKNFPWLRSVTHLAGYFSFICPHSTAKGSQCAYLCIERQRRDCLRLVNALHLVYKSARNSPHAAAANRHAATVHSYIDSRCRGLLHAPFSTLLKAACVIDEETWQDAMGPAWELITDSDFENSAAAACLFLLTTLKLHESSYDLIQRQLEHSDPVERISAIYRFQLMWQSRFQVWSRMEAGAQTRFKVPPPNIDFVLPSPMIGISVASVVDAPWLPKTSSHLSDVTTLHGHESVKALVTATTTHHRQQIETLNKALMAEEKRIRSARDNYPLTAVCLTVLTAAQEPSLAKASAQHTQQEKEKQPGNDEQDVNLDSPPLRRHHHGAKPFSGGRLDEQQIRRLSLIGNAQPQHDSSMSAHHPHLANVMVNGMGRRLSTVLVPSSAVLHSHSLADQTGVGSRTSSTCLLSTTPSFSSVHCSSASAQPASRMREAGDPPGPLLAPPGAVLGTSVVATDSWNEPLARIGADLGTSGGTSGPQLVTITPHSFFTPAACATIAKLFEMLLDYDVGYSTHPHAQHHLSPSTTSAIGALSPSTSTVPFGCTGVGLTPGQAAADVIWHLLCDDPTLTLRFFFERLTHTDKLDKLLLYLRHLVTHFGGLLPPQAAHSICNYFVGLVMFCVRTASDETNETVAKAIAQLSIVVPSLVGFSFKDLKQSLRKEQCDPTLMLSAGVPGAKKLVIHGPDLSSIPSQFPVGDDTQFGSLLMESLDFFNIEPDRRNSFYLVDTKTKHIYLPTSYVRDFYPFRRNVYPQLSLVQMRPDLAGDKMRHQTLALKFADINRTLFNDACLHVLSSTAAPGQVFFIHDEFIRLPTFPRKALQFDHVELVSGSETAWLAKQLHKMDVLHKITWIDFLSAFLCRLPPSIPIVVDLPLYLSVVTGSLVLHTDETSSVLRRSLALIINLARHYRTFFATEGYTFVCPTVFQIYCCYAAVNAESVRTGIEFACKQMYVIHRKPFLLQLMGSVAELLVASPSTHYGKHLCTLLAQIGATPHDALNVMELINEPKPLKTLDFCYEDEEPTFHLIDCIRLAIAVVAYGGDSPRTSRMLVVLDTIVPQCVASIVQSHSVGSMHANLMHPNVAGTISGHGRKMHGARDDITAIGELASCMKALVAACSFLTKGYAASERQLESTGLAFYVRHGRRPGQVMQAAVEADLADLERGAEDAAAGQNLTALRDFRLPRDCLLSIMASFFPPCVARLRELQKTGISQGGAVSSGEQQSTRGLAGIHELLSARDHIRLAEISQTLLKVAPYDPPSMNCVGLERYFVDVLPATNWAQESTRPAFALILRRLDRLFARLVKKASLRQCLDWSAAAALITGVSATLHQSMYLAHVKEIKSLINSCLNIILADPSEFSTGVPLFQHKRTDAGDQPAPFRAGSLSVPEEEDTESERLPPTPSSAAFLFAVVRLLATEMQAQGELYGLASVCEPLIGQSLTAAPPEKLHSLVLSVLLPLLLSSSVSTRTSFMMRKADVSHVLSLLLHLASPPHRHVVASSAAFPVVGNIGARRVSQQNTLPPGLSIASGQHRGAAQAMTAYLFQQERATTVAAAEAHMAGAQQWARENVLSTVFLGLKLLSLRFDAELASQWPLVAKHCRGLAMRPIASPSLWRFLGFLAAARPSLFALLAPFIRWKLSRLKLSELSTADSQLQSDVIQSMLAPGPPLPRAQLLLVCAEELRILRRNASAMSALGTAFSNTQQLTVRGTQNTTAGANEEALPLQMLARRTSSAIAAPIIQNKLLHRSSTATTFQSEQGSTPRSSSAVPEELQAVLRQSGVLDRKNKSSGGHLGGDTNRFGMLSTISRFGGTGSTIGEDAFVHTAHPYMPPFGWRRRGMVIKRQHRKDKSDDGSHYADLLAEIEGLPFADAAPLPDTKTSENLAQMSTPSRGRGLGRDRSLDSALISAESETAASSTVPKPQSFDQLTDVSRLKSGSAVYRRGTGLSPTHSSDTLTKHSPHRLISGSVRPLLESAYEGEELQIEMAETKSSSKEKSPALSHGGRGLGPGKQPSGEETTALLDVDDKEKIMSSLSSISEAISSRTTTENRSIVVIVEDTSNGEEFL